MCVLRAKPRRCQSTSLPSHYLPLGVCSRGSRWLEAGSEWQVEKKEQTDEWRRGDVCPHISSYSSTAAAATDCGFLLQLRSKAHSDGLSTVTKCRIFSSSNHQKLKITHPCTVLALVFKVCYFSSFAETGTIFRHNLMHLCCLETIWQYVKIFCVDFIWDSRAEISPESFSV